MRLNSAKKIIVEDFSETEQTLVRKLSDVLNPFIWSVFTAISKQLTFSENIKSQVFVINLSVGESSKVLKWEVNERPTAIFIANALLDGNLVIAQPLSVSWTYDSGKLSVTFVGLNAAKAHKITLVGVV